MNVMNGVFYPELHDLIFTAFVLLSRDVSYDVQKRRILIILKIS